MCDEEEAEMKEAALENASACASTASTSPTRSSTRGRRADPHSKALDPEDPTFQKAMKACEGTMPDGRHGSEGGE